MTKKFSKKIGLLFGSFNPVHNGHMAIANYFAEFSDLDQVWMVVSPHNPLKQKDSLLQDYHRLTLVQNAIGDYRKIKASNVEFKLSKPSFTIHTLTHLQEKHPDHEFVLICGEDTLTTFHKWKNFEAIIEHHHLYVYPRPGTEKTQWHQHEKIVFVNAPLMEISSSFIRQSIKEKKDVRFLMPESVANYIDEMSFYRK